MSAAALQKLDFMVSLIDRVSGPAGKVMKTMDTVTTNIQGGMRKIGYGTAGLVGVGYALDRLIAPSKELNKALGDVRSLDVVDDVLKKVTKSSLDFTSQYGGSAADFVRASYDIQSAINGLVGNELAEFTNTSAILAKGTKSDTATITSYVGTMYGIFQQNAKQMGKAQWVQQLAGQTAHAVQLFKTTGSEMAAAYGNLGAEATTHGIAMNEQMAILGALQATMTGTEAGTKYKSFLAGVGKAQKTLGLVFTDSQGQMLPIIDILSKIRGKFGDIDTVAESDLLQKAFGRKEAVGLIKLLSQDISGLDNNITAIGQNTGMQKAMQMADAIKDPFEVAGGVVSALQIKIGQSLMPGIHALLATFTGAAVVMMAWMDQFPLLTEYIGYAGLGVAGLVAGLSVLSIVVGISKFLLVGWTLAAAGLNAVLALTKLAIFNLLPAVWGFTAALLANPITWIVLGVVALGAALVALVVYWDDITAAIGRFFNKISSLAGIKDLLTGLIPQFVLDLIAVDKTSGSGAGTATQSPKPIASPAALSSNSSAGASSGGGVINRISNATSANNSRSIGDVNVYNSGNAISGQQLADELAFLAG